MKPPLPVRGARLALLAVILAAAPVAAAESADPIPEGAGPLSAPAPLASTGSEDMPPSRQKAAAAGDPSSPESPPSGESAPAEQEPAALPPAREAGSGKAAAESSDALDFDLLGTPTAAPVVDEGRLRLRRRMLTAHQAMGLALFTSTLSLAVVGQLSYNDRFGGGPSTGRYELPHGALAYTTIGLFASTGLMAALAPVPIAKSNQGFDRVTLHKIGLLTATAGMVAQGVLGIVTSRREGYLNQRDFARAHQVVGYATTAAMAVGVGALVF